MRILRMTAIALALAIIPALATAQAPRRRVNTQTAMPTKFAGDNAKLKAFGNVGAVDRPEPNSGSYNRPVVIVIKSDWQLERERVLAMRQASRDAAKERRERTWASLPTKYYSDEDLAKSKYSIARQLWQHGRVDAARQTLAKLIEDYPATDTAEGAKVVLERF
jgi:hypothetical protein